MMTTAHLGELRFPAVKFQDILFQLFAIIVQRFFLIRMLSFQFVEFVLKLKSE